MGLCAAIFAHNEARLIRACLASLPIDCGENEFHILINGSTDKTASIARQIARGRTNVHVHELHPGGKARTWNHFVFDIWDAKHDIVIFMDGDAQIASGSFEVLTDALARHPGVNASSGMPMNGRKHLFYQDMIRRDRGVFGDLYAVRGDFLRRMRDGKIRLPEDLIGDDGLVAALAATNLQDESHWNKERVVPADGAGFYCEPVNILNMRTWLMQYRRMINYSVRHFQNRIIADLMQRRGPSALPQQLQSLYPIYLPGFKVRRSFSLWWFDLLALRRMRKP